jgi:tetratricopeptide (TPR) repeat protein
LVWARATEPDQVITAYAEAAEQLRLPGLSSGDSITAARRFVKWLAVTDRRWLVILDDVADPEAVEQWWPDGSSRSGWVLATTRRDDARLSSRGRVLIRLGLYDPEEARSYLRRRLTDAGCAHLHAPGQADELAVELDHLPLALGHAAAYLINKRRTMADYLALLRDKSSRLGDLLPPSADTEGYGHPITSALLVSLDAVEEADITRLAKPLLHLAALMDPVGHPAALWTTRPALDYLRTARPAHRRRLRRHHPVVTEAEVRSALERLRTYALITQDTDTAPVRMHALTARAVRETIRPDILPTLAHTSADSIDSLWPDFDHEDRELSAALRADTVHLDHHTFSALWQPRIHACIYKVSISLTEAGLYQQAVEYGQGTLQNSIDIHGLDHPCTLIARNNLAGSYSAAGRTQEALKHRVRVLADSERILGTDHPATLTARSNLAGSYSDAGRIQKALELGERVLADRERILGTDHPDTLTTRNNLANSYGNAGRIQKALELGEQVLADRERILGTDHPDTLNTLNSLAGFYSDAGRIQEALELGERVLADTERILGTDHPATLTARSNLAGFYSDAGRIQEALELGEQVLADRERILGTDHPDTLRARNNLANSYGDAGRTQEALELRERALPGWERILGHDHPDTLTARSNLAGSYSGAGRIQEALELGEQVLADTERILGPDHPDTLDARNNLESLRDAAEVQHSTAAIPTTAPDLQPP